MTEQYKVGDKVLVECEIKHVLFEGSTLSLIQYDPDGCHQTFRADVGNNIRPCTPRQEFEYGEEVEARLGMHAKWEKAKYIGASHLQSPPHQHQLAIHIVNTYDSEGNLTQAQRYWNCRKLQPRDTITIGGVTYYKDDFENAVKDLKPVEGK